MLPEKIATYPLPPLGKSRHVVIHIAFFLLFPGFFFYQTLLGAGIINAFLGGYFSYISLLLMPPLILIYLKELKRDGNNFCPTNFYYMAFLSYVFLIVAINFISGTDYRIALDYFMSIIFAINIFIIFKMIDFNDNAIKITSITSLITMSLIVFYFSTDGLFYLASLGISQDPKSVASYQGFARSYLLTFIFAVSSIKPVTFRMIMYSAAIPTLFLNGARSEFIALLFIIPIIEMSNHTKKIMTSITLFLIFIFTSLVFNYIIPLLPDNRTLQLLDLSTSNSVKLRHDFTEQALHTIYTNPILGDFGSYIYGESAHNILAVWVDFGLMGFIFSLTILLSPTLILVFHYFSSIKKSSYFVLSISLMFMAVLLVFTSKNFQEMYVGAALGAYSNFRYWRKYA